MSWFVVHVLKIIMLISSSNYYLSAKQFLRLIVFWSQVTKSSYTYCNRMYPVNHHTMPMFKLFVVVAPLLVFLLWSTVESGKLHPQWCTFISDLCKRFEDSPKSFSLIYVHREYSAKNPFLHLLPPILVWAPVEQYNGVLPDGFTCPRCDSSSILYGFGWMNGIYWKR